MYSYLSKAWGRLQRDDKISRESGQHAGLLTRTRWTDEGYALTGLNCQIEVKDGLVLIVYISEYYVFELDLPFDAVELTTL